MKFGTCYASDYVSYVTIMKAIERQETYSVRA